MLGIKAIQKFFWKKRCEAFQRGLLRYRHHRTDPEFIAGLMLYWAEGTKHQGASVSNSDPRLIRFMMKWFRRYYEISPIEFSIHLHLHTGQNENKMKRYWSDMTKVPLDNFHKSFVKPEGSGYRKNHLYNGTVKLRVKRKGSTYTLFEILGSLAAFLHASIGNTIKPEAWMKKLPYA